MPWWNGRDMASPKYGDIAIRRLVEKMETLGSDKSNLVAKVFGGAYLHAIGEVGHRIGDQNIATAEKLLRDYGIEIIGRNTGGENGRRIVFHSHTNQVFMKYLGRSDGNGKEHG